LPGIPHVSHNPHQGWRLMITHPRPLIEVFAMILRIDTLNHQALANQNTKG
jgi:hypothetical protein